MARHEHLAIYTHRSEFSGRLLAAVIAVFALGAGTAVAQLEEGPILHPSMERWRSNSSGNCPSQLLASTNRVPPPQGSVLHYSGPDRGSPTSQVLSPLLMSEHLPCTATAVMEDEMQNCSLIKKSRKRGPDVWLLRWSDKSISGKRIYRKRAIGTVEEYPDSESARRAVASLIARINAANPRIGLCSTTLSQLSNHFERIELAPGNTWRSYSTKRCYAGYLKRWIVPQWGTYELRNIKTIEVESWLRRLPLARSSCAKIRGVMSVLFNHACRYELFDSNPIHLVRQGAKRNKTPCVLTPAEIRVLADGLAIRERTLVLLAASTGLRQSELFGLKWGDIHSAEGTMNVTRSIVCGVVGPCKTESSQKPVPIHPLVVDALTKWREVQRYRKLDDWVFASGCRRGRKPYWGQAILRKYILPKAQELGIERRFGWHTFRHTYSTLLRSVGTEFKVMQELLRHSSLRSTLDVYTQAITPAKHAAQAAVMSLVFSQQAESDTRA